MLNIHWLEHKTKISYGRYIDQHQIIVQCPVQSAPYPHLKSPEIPLILAKYRGILGGIRYFQKQINFSFLLS